jgi:hypothetical protein
VEANDKGYAEFIQTLVTAPGPLRFGTNRAPFKRRAALATRATGRGQIL